MSRRERLNRRMDLFSPANRMASTDSNLLDSFSKEY
jgi:hypothetical protein